MLKSFEMLTLNSSAKSILHLICLTKRGCIRKIFCSELQRRKEAGESNLVIRRGQIVTASRVAADMDHFPSLLTQNSSSAPVPSGNDQSG